MVEAHSRIRYNLNVDAFITRQAGVDLEALHLLAPGSRSWGLVFGHKRGFRFIVERAFPSPAGWPLPPAARLEALNRLWEGRLIGLFSVRDRAVLKPEALGPYFYGKLVLDLRGPSGAASAKAYVVDFERRFFLSPIALSRGRKGGTE